MTPRLMSNRLSHASSPYLRQHADNPVDWYPWGEEALTAARESGRPILLSIGYAACHWCHVMAHESFEDPATAAVMNEKFINIKVDREERPDLDKLYQTAQMLLSQRPGGWPLTMFLSADDQVPFFGGTYFPPQARHGLPAFAQVLAGLAQWHADKQGQLQEQNQALRAALEQMNQPPAEAPWPESLANQVIEALVQPFDVQHGGFGGAPKFARPTQLQWLLAQDNPQAQHMATHTLTCMAEGGVQDHVGGGFYRYSVDELWMIPHFEKMLYDQALLLPLYAQAEPTPVLRAAAQGIARFVINEMQDGAGGFYSSLDADSDGAEGTFYLWRPDEVRAVLSREDFEAFAYRFGLDRPANFEGRWHLHGFNTLIETAAHVQQEAGELQSRMERALEKLYGTRSTRMRPGLDDKILTSWNALMIRGLVQAGQALSQPEWVAAARRAWDFLKQRLWDGERLHVSFSQGQAYFNAYLDDYAFTLEAGLLLLQERWSVADLRFVERLAGIIAERFEAPDGGLYFTTHDHESLIARPRLMADDVTPSGAAVAAEALAEIGYLLGRSEWVSLAERTLARASGAVVASPGEHARFMEAQKRVDERAAQVIVRGSEDQLAPWQAAIATAKHATCYAIPTDELGLPEALAAKRAEPEPVAYVCTGTTCSEPVRTVDELVCRLAT